jgi:hypothetical protein
MKPPPCYFLTTFAAFVASRKDAVDAQIVDVLVQHLLTLENDK